MPSISAPVRRPGPWARSAERKALQFLIPCRGTAQIGAEEGDTVHREAERADGVVEEGPHVGVGTDPADRQVGAVRTFLRVEDVGLPAGLSTAADQRLSRDLPLVEEFATPRPEDRKGARLLDRGRSIRSRIQRNAEE